MAELGKELANVVCHGEVARSLVVVSFEVDARKISPIPVFCDGVTFLEGVTQMFGVSFTNILNDKIVDDEAECDGTPFVAPQTRCGEALVVSRGL